LKKIEKILQESEEKYRKLIEIANDAIFLADVETGIILEVNKQTEELLGVPVEEIVGMHHTQVYPPEDVERNKDLFNKYSQVDKSITLEDIFVQQKDGRKIPVEISSSVFKLGAKKVILGIFRDITERKHMEEDLKRTTRQLSLMFESLPIIPYICKAEGNFGATYVGTEVEKVTGFKPEDFTSNDTFWADRIHPDDASRVFADIPTLFEKGHYEHEYRWQVSDNSYKWFYDVLRLVELPDKTTNQIVGIWLDITERKKAEEMLQEQKKALEQKNIALSEVLGQIELEKKQIKDNVITNAENLLLPIIQKLRLTGESRKYVQLLRKNLLELTSSFGTRLTEKRAKLTSREIEICNMVRNGLTSKEIANLLNISSLTIEKHRINIRRKLGIINKGINLTSFLKTL
jgi:PAS domain S-box-containing protein